MSNKTYPLFFSHNIELPIGKVVVKTDKAIPDRMLADTVLAPSYVTDDKGNKTVLSYGIVTNIKVDPDLESKV